MRPWKLIKHSWSESCGSSRCNEENGRSDGGGEIGKGCGSEIW